MEDVLQKRVGFGPRLGAYLIDGIFITVIALIMMFAFGAAGAGIGAEAGGSIDYNYIDNDLYDEAFYGWEDEAAEATYGGIMGAFMGALLGLIVGWIGYILIEAFTGASLGKMILGLKAGTLDGKKGSVGLYVSRAAVKFAWLFPIIIMAIVPASFGAMQILYYALALAFFIGCWFSLRESKQSLHDQITKTAIYYKKDLS